MSYAKLPPENLYQRVYSLSPVVGPEGREAGVRALQEALARALPGPLSGGQVALMILPYNVPDEPTVALAGGPDRVPARRLTATCRILLALARDPGTRPPIRAGWRRGLAAVAETLERYAPQEVEK